jgi:ribulose-phosphate 3-epimerase
VTEVRSLLTAMAAAADIEVDGGVDVGNAAALVSNGATVLVAGAAIFHTPDAPAALRALRQAAGAR